MSPFATADNAQALEVVPTGDLSPWQVRAVTDVLQTAALPTNWDYNSPPTEALVTRAILFLTSIQLELPAPQVVPVAGGGIQFEWQVRPRELEIEFRPDGSVEFLKSEHGEPVEEGELRTTPPLVSWLIGG